MINRNHIMNLLLVYGLLALIAFIVVPTVNASRLYDEEGKYQGRILDNGRIYDETGEYQGRIERDRLYDETGEYRGRIDGSRVENDRDQWTGATVRNDDYYRMHRGYFPEDYE